MVVRSSAETEFRVLSHGICETLLIKILLKELKVLQLSPLKLYCNNSLSFLSPPLFVD